MAQPLIDELETYLAKFDIDASRVKSDDYDEDGFTYLSPAGPMTTTGKSYSSERREWPSKEVYDNVCALIAGIPLKPKPEEKKPATKKVEPK